MGIRHIRPILLKRGRNRTVRPKTFTSEDAAKKYAEAQGLKEYSLEDLNNPSAKTRKIRIVQ